MIMPTTRRLPIGCWMIGLAVAACAGCGGGTAPRETTEPHGPLGGLVTVDGSSTVLPISRAMATAFHSAHPGVAVLVSSSGTGGGFKKFCAGQLDVSAASRPINAAESRQCEANHVEFIELPIAFDSLSVVVNGANTFADCLTVGELKTIWEPAAEGRMTRWNQVRSTFPDQPLALYGPGADSGTFDYFTLAIVGGERRSRKDYTASEDDDVLVRGVSGNPGALGYFGYAYYLANRGTLRAVAIDNGHGCVGPSAKTVEDTTYQPLARPMFIYLSAASAARREVHEFGRFYVDPGNATFVRDLGYVPLPTATLLTVGRRLDESVMGSMFGGRGSVIGVTADAFQDDDRIRSALVR
jgi:phosphate transport system substrate-binding protein